MAFDKVVDSALLDAGMRATADAIRTKTGDANPVPWENEKGFSQAIAKIQDEEEDSGIDTSDATATAADMLAGATAYVNGEKIEGKLIAVKEGSGLPGDTNQRLVDNYGNIISRGTFSGNNAPDGVIVRPGADVWVSVPKEEYGDAASSDVAKGKTFTSESGLMAEGALTEVKQGEELLTVAAMNAIIDAGNGLLKVSSQFNPDKGSDGDRLIRSGAIAKATVWLNDLGTAKAADVAKGKTFTSAAGLLVEGTNEGGGGGAEVFYTPEGKCYVEHMHITGMKANGDTGSISGLYTNAVYLKSVVMEGGNISGAGSASTFAGCTSLVSAALKNVTVFGHYLFRNCTSLESVQLGSVGFPVTNIGSPYIFVGAKQNPIVTIYVDATVIANIPTDVTKNSPWGASNATVIYRNSTTGEVITE